MIIKKTDFQCGIAVQKKADKNWRIYWIESFDYIIEDENVGILYLPLLNDLPIIPNAKIAN